jgi:hypothetical protein
MRTRNFAAANSKASTTVTRYGNKILMNTMRNPDGGADLYFSWVSGNRLVVVTFSDSEDDEFLKEYLHLNPSSL